MRKTYVAGLALAAALAPLSAATAQTWTEQGDAGDLPGTAQVTIGAGPLISITGAVSSATDGDLYQIFITGGGTFSATTVGMPGNLVDTQLFLFNAAGLGVYANDDFFEEEQRSNLPSGISLTPAAPGLYYLLITGYDRDPASAGGPIFPDDPVGPVGPTGPGGGQPLSGYTGSGTGSGSIGTYTIALTGAEFAAIPEPGTLTLLGAGALGLLAHGRRRRRQTA